MEDKGTLKTRGRLIRLPLVFFFFPPVFRAFPGEDRLNVPLSSLLLPVNWFICDGMNQLS